MEGYTRGLLQGSHNVLEQIIELSQEDLLKQEEEEHGTEEDTTQRPDGGSGYY